MQEIPMMLLFFMTLYLASSMTYALEGTATFYEPPYVPSACNGNEKQQNSMIAAASDSIWDNGAACERSYIVKCIGGTNKMPQPCTGGKVLVTIVDYCQGCDGTINLSREAFALIAHVNAGKIVVEYD